MKIVKELLPGERMKVNGDLIIEGDVGEGASIVVQDGALTIAGNVRTDAAIRVNISEKMRSDTSMSQLIQMTNPSSVTIKNGGVVITGSVTRANLQFGNHLVGNVAINNRIFSKEGMVTKLGGDKYQILPGSGDVMELLISGRSPKPGKGVVSATVDGVEYQGHEIIVEGKEVFVDGAKRTNITIPSAHAEPVRNTPPKVSIKGSVFDNVTLNSDADMEIEGDIGSTCRIIGDHSGIHARNIGQNTLINVKDKIVVHQVSQGCNLTSKSDGLKAKRIGERVTVATRDAIDVEDIGDGSKLTSTTYGLSAGTVGKGVVINVRDAIKVGEVGEQCILTSITNSVTTARIDAHVTVNARDGIRTQRVADHCTLTSSTSSITVNGFVGSNSTLNARDAIQAESVGDHSRLTSTTDEIRIDDHVGKHAVLQARDAISTGSLGSKVRLTSSTDKIRVRGHAGSQVEITARDSISMRNVGDSSIIVSNTEGVNIENIGIKVQVRARDDINIAGSCPDPDSLNLQSGTGKIRRPKKAAAPETPAQPKVTPGGLGLFPVPKPAPSPAPSPSSQAKPEPLPAVQDEVEYDDTPDAFICPITFLRMRDPVISTASGMSYERSALIAWVDVHGTCPKTRLPMTRDNIVTNRQLKDAIEEWVAARTKEVEAPKPV